MLAVAAISLATCGSETGEPRAREAPPAAGKPARLPPELASIARLFGGGRAWLTTAFYEASGKLTKTHLGAYATEAKLNQDIRRYALGG